MSNAVPFYITNSDGDVIASGSVGADTLPTVAVSGGVQTIVGVAVPGLHYVDTQGKLQAYTPAQAASRENFPGPGYRWSPKTMSWVGPPPPPTPTPIPTTPPVPTPGPKVP